MSELTIRWATVMERYKALVGLLHHQRLESFSMPIPSEYRSISDYLDRLSVMSLDSENSMVVLYCFKPVFLDVIARLVSDSSFEEKYKVENNIKDINKKGIFTLYALSKLVSLFNVNSSTCTIALLEQFLSQNSFLDVHDTHLSITEINMILISFYRLLSHSITFKKFISSKVIHLLLDSNTVNTPDKTLAAKILAKALNYSSETEKKLLVEHTIDSEPVGQFETMQTFDYTFIAVHEAIRLSRFLSLPDINNEQPNSEDLIIRQTDLSSLIRLVYGVLIPALGSDTTCKPDETFIPIESLATTLNTLTRKVLSGKPIILYGGHGSGKTLLLNHLHSLVRHSNSDLVTLHLNEQTDIKLLLGTYVSSHEPGKFVWKDGVLTNAVKQGKWLLIEDIDNAKNEVLSIFTSLIETNELVINGTEKIPIKNGFQIIATISTDDFEELGAYYLKTDNIQEMEQCRYWQTQLFEREEALETLLINENTILPDLISLNKFELIHHNMPTPIELLRILVEKYQQIKLPNNLLWQKLIALFYYMKFRVFSRKSFIAMNNGLSVKKIDNFELFRLANRIKLLFENDSEIISKYDDLLDKIYSEAVDVFTSFLQNDTIKNHIISKIGLFLELPASTIKFHTISDTNNYVPELKIHFNELYIGRSKLSSSKINSGFENFALTTHSLQLLEKLSISVNLFEPVLLTGETGCGKTTIVQTLAKLLGKKLTVLNMSQETEANDLIGGYKPILNKQKSLMVPVQNCFLTLFSRTFNLTKNEKFLKLLNKSFNAGSYQNVFKLWKKAILMARDYLDKQKQKLSETNEDFVEVSKKRKLDDKLKLLDEWNTFELKVLEFQVHYEKHSSNTSLQFDFIEGSLVKAVRNGDWVLLDEINLASPETLENISDLLNGESGKLLLTEKASEDNEVVLVNKEFRLFGCMNPSTDVGKKNLPENIRGKFNEIFVDNPDKNINDLRLIVRKYLWNCLTEDDYSNNEIIDDVVFLYYEIKKLNNGNFLVDGSKNKIVVNIRVLSRALIFTTDIIRTYGVRRSLYEAFNMILLTLLDSKSEEILKPIIYKYTIGKAPNVKAIIKRIPPKPSHLPENKAVQFDHYWLEKGEFDVVEQPHYIITPFVKKNLLNLVRASLTKRFPILIQGPTSSGKTSMITYLAKITGNKVIRINNHEHTDLQEYLGSYVSDSSTGKLVFKHGPLIEALKKGYWIILDELNLASSEILEGINRLLDDNREIFLTETQELIKPHKNFLLFATQNPPGAVYGGRKFLSKAFKNRFLELNFDDIPQGELETILCNRCQIPPSYAKKIVLVYKELNFQRSSNRIFETKNSFATLRDLFRWGSREAVGYDQLAMNGYMLLAEKTRKAEESVLIKKAIEKVMKVQLEINDYYLSKFEQLNLQNFSDVVWTKEMKKLSVLIIEALKNNENILLVGETGCGKTTVCSNLAQHYYNQNMVFLNAHQNLETSDIIGSQRPLRNRSKLQEALRQELIAQYESLQTPWNESLDNLEAYNVIKAKLNSSAIETVEELLKKSQVLFEWNDGPLVNAMKNGDIFLFDEISLAEDSVLERLNSVLEPEKTLYLTEFSNDIDLNLIVAQKGFQFLATMNPGGDYGKKELSPALRNRFTEIYVPSMSNFSDVALIVESKLEVPVKHLTNIIVQFSEWFSIKFSSNNSASNNGVISIRDILAWVDFINKIHDRIGVDSALLHGVCLVFVDALGTNNTAYLASDSSRLAQIKKLCVLKLSDLSSMELEKIYLQSAEVSVRESSLQIGDFEVSRLSADIPTQLSFNLQAPTTAMNALRVLRAMVINKPILLEGDPGVGKSSLIDALAKATNRKLTRINLSDQTDLVDLFGSDAPVEGGSFGEFTWKDAPFLRAMKCGEWVLLDEMNLASPSLLEALNSVFDFRQKVYIPELDREFECHRNFRVFAAQNPQVQGGGRKGLPKSFINRFTNVYIGKLNQVDIEMICELLFKDISTDTIAKMVKFVFQLETEININKQWGGLGGPWEFNIRDIIKYLEIDQPCALDLVFAHKFRSEKDRQHVYDVYHSIFGSVPDSGTFYYENDEFVQANDSMLPKVTNTCYSTENGLLPLQCNIRLLELIYTSVTKNLPVLLVGPTLGGKSDLINFAANAVGAKLETVHIHNEVDIADLVGGLDQYHIDRELLPFLYDLSAHLTRIVLSQTQSTHVHSIYSFLDYLTAFKRSLSLSSDQTFQKLDSLTGNLNTLASLVGQLDLYVERLEKIKSRKGKQFQYFDGVLVDALEKGYWLHLSNINLVSSSIVDRLNSLTEKNGVLVVSENSSTTGEPKIIKPHPNFRLFFSMNPKYGELSRAMRNRCVEIYVDSFENRATEFDRLLLGMKNGLMLSPATNQIEDKLLSLAINEQRAKESFASALVRSKHYTDRQLLMITDILRYCSHKTIKQQIVYFLSCFVSTQFQKTLDRFLGLVSIMNVFNATELGLLEKLGKVTQFIRSCIDLDTSLISLLPKETVSYAFVCSAFDFYEYYEKYQAYWTTANSSREKLQILQQVMDVLRSGTSCSLYSAEFYGLLTRLSVLGKLFIDVEEPEKANFIIEEIIATIEKLSLADALFKLEEVKEVNLQHLAGFKVENSDSMTQLWNYFILLPDHIETMIQLLPVTWKPFIKSETQNGKVCGVLLDLDSFRQSINVSQSSQSYFQEQFLDLLEITEAYNTCKKKYHVDNEFLMLTIKSGKQYVSLSDRYVGKLVKPYPLVLNYVYKHRQFGPFSFVNKTFQKTMALGEVPGSRIRNTINDLKYLSEEMFKKSSLLISDQLIYFQNILSDWLRHVLTSLLLKHPNLFLLLDDVWRDQKIDNLLAELVKSNLTKLVSAIEKFFFPAFIAIFSQKPTLAILGKAYIFFGAGLVHLFVPSAPYDPAICEFILYDVASIQQKNDVDYTSALKIVRKLLSGDKEIFFEKGISEACVPESFKPRVQRPMEGSIENLYYEWTSFLEASVGVSPVSSLFKLCEQDQESTFNKINLLHKNTERFLFNLKENYTDFQDLNQIFQGGTLGLNFGFALTQMALPDTTRIDALSSLLYFKEFVPKNDISAVLQSFSFFHKEGLCSTTHNDVLNSTLINSFKKWKIETTRKEKEEIENGNIYKFKGEEDESEDAYKSLFPDFEEEENVYVNLEAFEMVKTLKNDTSIATMFIDTFLLVSNTSIVSYVSKLNGKLPVYDSRSGPATSAMVVALLHNVWDVLGRYESQDGSDFYFKPNLYQFTRCLGMIDDVLSEVSGLLKKWPENATLINIHDACEEIRNFSSSTTLARLIVKVEQILKFLNELILYSNGIDKKLINGYVENLTNLIVRWRQLELGSFNNLIQNEHAVIEKKLDESYYLLFELLIISYYNGEKNIEEIVTLLNMYMSNSTQGEYAGKLNLLKAFSVYLKAVLKVDNSLIDNIISFYDQFLAIVQTCLETTRTKLVKQINEVIQLASWKDTNIDALKESSKKSKRALYKVIKKYRAALNASVLPLIETGLEFQKVLDNKYRGVIAKESQVVNYFYLDNEAWRKQPKLLSDLGSFIPKVVEVRNSLMSEEIPDLFEYSQQIIQDMERLKKATPKELTDDNKKIVGSLKSEKRMLLSTVIKELKIMGLKTQEVQKYKLTVTAILANAKSLKSVGQVEDSHFFRILDLLPRLRNSVANCVEDVPRDDVYKGLAIVEHLLFTLYSLRSPLKELSEQCHFLETTLKLLQKVANGKDTILKKTNGYFSQCESFTHITTIFPKLIDFVVETMQKCGPKSEIVSFLHETKSSLEQCRSEYNLNHSASLNTISKRDFLTDFFQKINDLKLHLKQCYEKHTDYVLFFDLLFNWLEDVTSTNVKTGDIETSKSSLDEIIDLGKSIVVAIQTIKQDQADVVTTETQRYFMKAQQKFVTYKNHLYFDQIHGKMLKLVTNAENNLVMKYFMPLYIEYYNFTQLVLSKFSHNYVSVNKSTYILSSALLNLATNGFCSPQASSTEDQTESGSGGGLGDDVGADSKTNDDIDEEDLDEDAFTANKDEDDNNDNEQEHDDDKALDVEGDMEGKNEDMEGQDEDEDENADAEDLNEEIDDLDELDPNAVDEKMWDEQVDENKKEKDSNQLPDNSKPDDDDLQAMDEDAMGDNKDGEHEGEQDEEKESKQDETGEEGDDDADEEEDVGEQEDEVVQENNEQFDNNVPETEALELPEDLNLDDEEDGKEGDIEEDNEEDMNLDDNLDEEIQNNEIEDGKENGQEEENQHDEEMNIDETTEDTEQSNENAQDVDEEVVDEEGADKEDVDEDFKDVDDETKTKDKTDEGNDDFDDNNVESADVNLETNDESPEMEASAKQQAGEEKEGADEANENADTAGSSGSFHAQRESQKNEEKSKEEQKESEANEKLKESLKQLGNSLDEFYKKSEEILDSNEIDIDEQDKNAAENPDHFQHLDAEKDSSLRALGNATQDQIQEIDEDKEIKEEEKEEEEDINNEKKESANVEENDEIEGDKKMTLDDELEADKSEAFAEEEEKRENVEEEQDENDLNGFDDKEMKLDEQIEIDKEEEEFESKINESKVIDLENPLIRNSLEPPVSIDEATTLWQQAEFATNELSLLLCEQLRLILSPTIATKLKGDYKNGKRLNLKKIISYIASDFRKDKIWLKRTKPSKRNYQIMLSIDDSKSMSQNPETVQLTYNTISMVSKALTQLESGDLCIVKFGKDTSIIHNFNKKFDVRSDGPKCFQWFGFDDTVTNMKDLIDKSIEVFNRNTSLSSNDDLYKLQIIISDGICENHAEISRLVRKAKEEKLLIVFVIIDGLNKNNESITDMSQVKYDLDGNGNMNMKIDRYLDTFPFENYVIVDNIRELPESICQILRTFFMNSI